MQANRVVYRLTGWYICPWMHCELNWAVCRLGVNRLTKVVYRLIIIMDISMAHDP